MELVPATRTPYFQNGKVLKERHTTKNNKRDGMNTLLTDYAMIQHTKNK